MKIKGLQLTEKTSRGEQKRERGTERGEGDNGVLDGEFQRRKMGEKPIKTTAKKKKK